MSKVREMTTEDLEHFIEQKVVEILGDPDSGLKLNPAFKKKLRLRMKKSGKRIPHQEVLRKFGGH